MPKFSLIVILIFILPSIAFSQVTTSFMFGEIVDSDGKPLIEATVRALHEPSGTSYGAIAQSGGQYRISNMRVGGPY